MKLAVAVVCACVAASGCSRGIDYGSHPHLLGKLADLDVRMTQSDIAARVPELGLGRDLVDGPLTYRVWYDRAQRVETMRVLVDGAVDDLARAWGPGRRGTYSGAPASFYTDAARTTRFVVYLPPDTLTTQRFIVVAQPLDPLADLISDQPDGSVLGVPLLGQPIDTVIDQLGARGVHFERIGPLPHQGVLMSAQHHTIEDATYQLDVLFDPDTQRVTHYDLDFRHEIYSGRETLLARLEHKWGRPGPPGFTGSQAYPVDGPTAVLVSHADDIDVDLSP